VLKDFVLIVKKIKPSIALVFAIDPTNKVYGKGSGFVIETDLLVTCNHVVSAQNASILLQFPGSEEKISAKVVIRDVEHDLALLKFDKKEIKPLKICKLEEIKEGMPVIFAGYPLDLLSLTTHQGILSAITKDDTGNIVYLIDGTVNSGNSGCPLMNELGEVIGIVNAKRREQSDLLAEVEKLNSGALSIHGIDMINIYKALIANLQLGIGYAVPSVYIPKRQEVK